MVLQITRSMVVGDNRFDPKTAFNGWVNAKEENENIGFLTSDYISVCPGDVITFGPAVRSQWWHVVVYDGTKRPFRQVDIHSGITITDSLDDETAVMQYTADFGASFVRVVCDVRFANAFLVTKNRAFTAQDYRRLMTDFVPHAMTHMEVRETNCWTVVLNLQGSGIMTYGKKSILFEPSTVICIPPNVSFKKESAEGFSDIHLCTDTLAAGLQAENHPLVLMDDDKHGVERLMLMMLEFFWESEGHYRRLLEQLYKAVEQILFYQLAKSNPFRHQLNKMIQTIECCFTDPEFSSLQLYANTGYSPNYLRRVFKEQIGCTPTDYIVNLRIEYAKKLMNENRQLQATVAQISSMAGFRDSYYFSRVFKKKTGLAPIEYMKNRKKS